MWEEVISKLEPEEKGKPNVRNTGSSVPGSGDSVLTDLEARGPGAAGCSAG